MTAFIQDNHTTLIGVSLFLVALFTIAFMNVNLREPNSKKGTIASSLFLLVAVVCVMFSAYVYSVGFDTNHTGGEPVSGTITTSSIVQYKEGGDSLITAVSLGDSKTAYLVFANYQANEAEQVATMKTGDNLTLYCIKPENAGDLDVMACTMDENFDLPSGVQYFESNMQAISGRN